MTSLNEIEKTKEEIKVLETKLSLLEKIEKHKKSPAEEAYKRVFGKYPGDGFSWTVEDERCWYMFQKGYDYAYEKTVSKCQPTPLEKLQKTNWYVDAKTLLKSNWETTREVNIKWEKGFIYCPYIPDITLVNMKESPYEIKIEHKARRLEKDV